MRDEYDLTQSKRPIRRVHGEEDIPGILEEVHEIGQRIERAQELALAMGLNDKYSKEVAVSFARFVELHQEAAKTPMTEQYLSYHAEMRGRMNERLGLTLEIEGAKRHISLLDRVKKRSEQLLARLREKGSKK